MYSLIYHSLLTFSPKNLFFLSGLYLPYFTIVKIVSGQKHWKVTSIKQYEHTIDNFMFRSTCLHLKKSQAVLSTGGGHTTKKEDSERAG